MKPLNSVFERYETSVFERMSRLAREHDAINLGQGFPEDGFPHDVIAYAAAALTQSSNQYPPMMGLPDLRQAIAAHESRFYGLAIDWQLNTLVTSGATEAIAATLTALLQPGDEVVLLAPLYDAYLPIIEQAGGIARVVSLEPPAWDIPLEELQAVFSDKTKLIILNTPMNPTGKVFHRAELENIAMLVNDYDTYAVCDEVYEHLVFDDQKHTPLATLPGMFERCVRIGSAGKTFSLTGWKVGFITASAPLIERIARVHQFLVFATPPNLQLAVAYGLNKEDAYFTQLHQGMQKKRDRFVTGLQSAGFEVLPCGGTYFAIVDVHSTGFAGDDEAFCQDLITHAKVAAIPVSAFYPENPNRDFARFCFAKRDVVLDEAIERLAQYAQRGP